MDQIAQWLAQRGTVAPIGQMQTVSAPVISGMNMDEPSARPPESPSFIWGQGGKRLSMDDISRQRDMAQQQLMEGADYSPVQHWTQGLARVAQALMGGFNKRQADKDAQAYSDQRGQDIANLLLERQGNISSTVPETVPDASASLPSINDGLYQEGQPLPQSGSAMPPGGASAQREGINPAIIAALSSRDPLVNSLAAKSLDRHYAQNTPQYFMSGKDRVMYNPGTGESQTVYDAQQDFQEYADSLGLEPGSDEYNEAMQDFVLRANGPTAIEGRVSLENTRQGNRESLEGIRQGNRRELRQTPTYANLHPRPSGGGSSRSGGGFGLQPPRTPGAVYAPIMDKVARGIPLTPGEQQVLSMRGRGTRSASGAPAAPAPASRPIATDAKGNKVQYNGKAWVPVK